MLKNYDEDLKEIKNGIKVIGEKILLSNKTLLEAAKKCDVERFTEAKSYLKDLSLSLNGIDNEIIKVLALYSPEAKDLREVVAYFKITNELLRASSNTRSLIKAFVRDCESIDMELINSYVIPLQTSTIKALELVVSMIDLNDTDELIDIMHEIVVEEDKTDELYAMLEKKIFTGLKDSGNFEKTHNILKAFRRSEKIADRAISIANLLLYIFKGGELHNIR